MMKEKMERLLDETGKILIGKEDVIRKVLMAIFARGHILLDDVPGVGKTSLAVALGKILGLDYSRIQLTPDVLPSDIIGFSIYNRDAGGFVYRPGTVNDTNLLLADEINRTSSRTQAALLEAMEENQVTVDGVAHKLEEPFIVIATQNQVGTAGTQLLPQAQLDRFLVKLSIGYPDRESMKSIIMERQTEERYAKVEQVLTKEEVRQLQRHVLTVTMKEEIVSYITDLVIQTRNDQWIELGISPRGAIALSHMAKACAFMQGRDYVIPEDVQDVFWDVCEHRIILSRKARAEQLPASIVVRNALSSVKAPYVV
jgi:MoxR-like ATPase